eukprot:scaffold21680_cov45-Phaeocystis_antarctica.AAC.1
MGQGKGGTHMPQLLLDAKHSIRVIVVQVRVHVIDNDHRHDGLAAHALKEKLPKRTRQVTLRAAGPARREPQKGKGIPPCAGFDTKQSSAWYATETQDRDRNTLSRSRRGKAAT